MKYQTLLKGTQDALKRNFWIFMSRMERATRNNTVIESEMMMMIMMMMMMMMMMIIIIIISCFCQEQNHDSEDIQSLASCVYPLCYNGCLF
jgi:hypothetical protein